MDEAKYSEALDWQLKLAQFWLSEAGKEKLQVIYNQQGKGAQFATRNEPIFAIPLMSGECYYWSEPICDLVWSASQSLPSTWALNPQALPAPCGFFWLTMPIRHHASSWPIRAISWLPMIHPTGTERNLTIIGPEGEGPPFIFGRPSISLDQLKPGDRIGITFFLGGDVSPLPIPMTIFLWPVETNLATCEKRLRDEHVGKPEAAQIKLKLFASMLAFLQQRILIPFRQRAARPVCRRFAKSFPDREPTVGIIKLREMARRHETGESRVVEWSCRWLVRGYWRNQWYPSHKYHRPKWIAPYLKGPEDKPLRNPGRLFAVIR